MVFRPPQPPNHEGTIIAKEHPPVALGRKDRIQECGVKVLEDFPGFIVNARACFGRD